VIPRPVLAVIASCMMLAATVAGFIYGAITAITQEVWPDL
jgi:hypothetical protein